MRVRSVRGACALAALLAAVPSASLAQQSLAGAAIVRAAEQPGPLVVEPVRSGVVFAPDVKITEVDDETGTLVGGYAGWLADERFLIGGGGYWLVNDFDDIDLGYGGVIVGWQVPVGSALRFGARGLVGGGAATLVETYYFDVPARPGPHGGSRPDGGTVARRYYVDDGFFVIEPQADVTIRLGRTAGINLGVGYRVVAGADDFDDRLSGLTGSLAFQVAVW